MTEEDDLVLDIDNEPESEKASLRFSFREGVIFIVDAADSMFEIDPEAGISYFAQCLEVIIVNINDVPEPLSHIFQRPTKESCPKNCHGIKPIGWALY